MLTPWHYAKSAGKDGVWSCPQEPTSLQETERHRLARLVRSKVWGLPCTAQESNSEDVFARAIREKGSLWAAKKKTERKRRGRGRREKEK